MTSAGNTAKVLIVEDNKENLDLLKYFLKSQDYQIFTALDGEEALKAVKEVEPDIILLDIMLPKKDGFTVCEEIKKSPDTRFIPIIMITALKELKDKIRSLEAGADDFISKPFENIELLTRVKSLLRVKYYHDELVKTNRALKEKNEVLIRLDHYKEELIHLIVHDMKNPLFVIQGNLQMMTMGMETGASDILKKYIDRIDRSANNLLRMVTNLIDISKIEAGTMKLNLELADLNALIRKCHARNAELSENEKKNWQVQLDSNLPPVKLDISVMERVIDSLISFAAANAPSDGNITLQSVINKNTIGIAVCDDGNKIPTELRNNLFDKFHQVEIKNEGQRILRGLGLTFCKLAVEAHSGKLLIDPEYQNGNRFIFTIPIKK